MGAIAMTKKKPDRKPAKEMGGEFTSIRIYTEDQVKLSQLSALKRGTLADTFQELFGELLDAALIEATEGRAAQLRRNEHKP
jgi:hypothetical protein